MADTIEYVMGHTSIVPHNTSFPVWAGTHESSNNPDFQSQVMFESSQYGNEIGVCIIDGVDPTLISSLDQIQGLDYDEIANRSRDLLTPFRLWYLNNPLYRYFRAQRGTEMFQTRGVMYTVGSGQGADGCSLGVTGNYDYNWQFLPYVYFYDGNRLPSYDTAVYFITQESGRYGGTLTNSKIMLVAVRKGYIQKCFWLILDYSSNEYVWSLEIRETMKVEESDMSDTIDYGNLPALDLCDTGFVSLYKPSSSQLKSIARKLWDASFGESVSKSVSNPIECVVSLNLVPGGATGITASTSKYCMLGSYNTGVLVPTINSQFFEVDMGRYSLSPKFGNILDYAPYTSVSLYLPYVGMVDLDTDDVMNHTINVKYRIDIVTGQLLATLLIDNSVYSQYTGNCSIVMPVTSADFTGIYTGTTKGWANMMGGLLGGVGQAMSGNMAGLAGGIGGALSGGIDMVTASGNSVRNGRSAGNSMTAGYLGTQQCFVVLTTPKAGNSIPTSFSGATVMLDYDVAEHYLSGSGLGVGAFVLVATGEASSTAPSTNSNNS